MPTAKLSDITGKADSKPLQLGAPANEPKSEKEAQKETDVRDPERRVTGTADIPLNSAGRKQSIALAKRCKGFFDKVYTSSMGRAKSTAEMIDSKAEVEHALDPFKLAEHEGKPVSSERVAINERVKNRPDEVAPGRSSISGKRGESFNQFADRGIEWAEKLREECDEDPELKILNVTHGRNMRLINAWAMAGFPNDRTVDTEEMTRDGDDWSMPGDLFRLDAKELKKVDGKPTEPGLYYARHGSTEYSQGEPTEQASRSGGEKPAPSTPNEKEVLQPAEQAPK